MSLRPLAACRSLALLSSALLVLAPTRTLSAQSAPSPKDEQVAGAVTPLPASMRAGATVLGYDATFKLVTLRTGTNGMVCLADDPKVKEFHPACYHESMEPFMARGRELRLNGTTKPDQVDSVRFAEVKSGKIKMPAAAMLYQIFAPDGSFDRATREMKGGADILTVIYVPGATERSTGLTAVPRKAGPWLMFPGTPKAHVMISEKM